MDEDRIVRTARNKTPGGRRDKKNEAEVDYTIIPKKKLEEEEIYFMRYRKVSDWSPIKKRERSRPWKL